MNFSISLPMSFDINPMILLRQTLVPSKSMADENQGTLDNVWLRNRRKILRLILSKIELIN